MKISVPTTADVGRLPAREIQWPIAEQRFRALAQRWAASGVWLTLWNDHGCITPPDDSAPPLWRRLWRGGDALGAALAALAGAALQKDASDAHNPADDPPDPWPDDVAVLAIPVRRRRRIVGVVLGCALRRDTPGEDFLRLCNQCRLDGTHAHTLARDIGPIAHDQLNPVADLLALTIEQARAIDAGEEESAVLTHNLQNTYEELNLIYRVSGELGIPQRPDIILQRVGQQVLEVCRARNIAFVLSEHQTDGENLVAHTINERIIQVGHCAPSVEALERLAESLNINADAPADHFLINSPRKHPGLEWSEDWLNHLIAVPMRTESRLLGLLLAINCNDEGDFTSVDVQLLRAVADRLAAFLENQRLYDDVADLLMALLHALVNSIDAKDPYTCGHSERVAFLSRALAAAAGLSQVECERVYLAGLLHDIGKIGVPDAVLCKTGRLTDEEFRAMQKHPEIGAHILARVRQVQDLLPGVLHHHERMDGRGYPHGLAGRDIPLLGRIICLADCFDAMTTNRTYRAALPLPTVLAEIRRCAATQFDPQLAEIFLGLDLAQLMNRAHDFVGTDAAIGQIGALNVMMKDLPSSLAAVAPRGAHLGAHAERIA